MYGKTTRLTKGGSEMYGKTTRLTRTAAGVQHAASSSLSHIRVDQLASRPTLWRLAGVSCRSGEWHIL